MKIIDVIFALLSGIIIGFVASDIFSMGRYDTLIVWVCLPLISLVCLWIAFLIGKKWLFIFQSAKFLLVGAVATVLDLKLFELLLFIPAMVILLKGISFLVATLLKYMGNKYWAFENHEPFNPAQGRQENVGQEVFRFLIVTIIGTVIDVASFYYFTKIMGMPGAISLVVWTKLAVIFAAVIAALFNFLGYKFLVFKK